MSEDKTTIFIDTQDMEERYGEELYKEYLEKENKQLKERYLLLENKCIELLEVIEEVREYIKDSCYYPELENYSNMTSEEVKELVQILDKVGE